MREKAETCVFFVNINKAKVAYLKLVQSSCNSEGYINKKRELRSLRKKCCF